MQQLDRAMARALVEAGYMPLSEYVGIFGHERASVAAAPEEHVRLGDHRTRPWTVPPHFVRPTRLGKRPAYKKVRSAS